MDLKHSQTGNLSLGFLSHASPVAVPNRQERGSDGSITFQIDSRMRDASHPVRLSPLQLLDQQSESCSNGKNRKDHGKAGNTEEEEEKVEEFRILGHSMCFKRKRETDLSSSSTAVSNLKSVRCATDLESRKNAVREWGDQCLQVADPDVFDIMEKEKQRQFKGIELIASENFVCKAVMEALGSHLTNKYSEGFPISPASRNGHCISSS